jgi:hypothetical protein
MAPVVDTVDNGGHTHVMTQTAVPAKQTPAAKRYDFVASVTKPINDRVLAQTTLKQAGMDPALVPDPTVDELRCIALDMRSKGSELGKTDRWQSACTWADRQITEAESEGTLDQSFARWAVLQGATWMCHAAE